MLHYARALLGLSAATPPLDTQTVTVATTGTTPDRLRGFGPGTGSISDGTSNIYGGATIFTLQEVESDGDGGVGWLALVITGNNANSGWTTMTNTTNSKSFNRADASYLYDGTYSSWTWTRADVGLGQFFPTSTGTKTVVFT
jgi:hypothetical protein